MDVALDPVRGPNALTDERLARLGRHFESRSPGAIIRWVVDAFHPYLLLGTSMTDAVLIDLAMRVEPSIEVMFIDTGYHFPETLQTLELVRRRYGLNLRVMTAPPHRAELWKLDPDNCCSAVKVGQLDRALMGKLAWMSGVRRAESPGRAGVPIVARDGRGLVKVNPLATWTDDNVDRYIRDHDVPVNPLVRQGYRSIGCQPCTRPVREGDHSRAGRWRGRDRTECGLHVAAGCHHIPLQERRSHDD